MFAWLLFGIGGFVCLLNFYLSFLRYPLHRFRGRGADSYRWSSGFPLLGSLFVALAWLGWLYDGQLTVLDIVALVLVAVDTGGLHWFLGVSLVSWLAGQE